MSIYHCLYRRGVNAMYTSKVFTSGESQAVEIPKELGFSEDEEILFNKIGNIVTIVSKNAMKDVLMSGCGIMGDDYFPNGREAEPVQAEREVL